MERSGSLRPEYTNPTIAEFKMNAESGPEHQIQGDDSKPVDAGTRTDFAAANASTSSRPSINTPSFTSSPARRSAFDFEHTELQVTNGGVRLAWYDVQQSAWWIPGAGPFAAPLQSITKDDIFIGPELNKHGRITSDTHDDVLRDLFWDLYLSFLLVRVTLTLDGKEVMDLVVPDAIQQGPEPPGHGSTGKGVYLVKAAIDKAVINSTAPGFDPPKYNDIHNATILVLPKPDKDPKKTDAENKVSDHAWAQAKKSDGDVVVKDHKY